MRGVHYPSLLDQLAFGTWFITAGAFLWLAITEPLVALWKWVRR